MATATRSKLLTLSEWYEYISTKYGRQSGLVACEQAMFQSEKNKVCIECLSKDNLVHETRRFLIKSTDYYMCQECLDLYAKKEG